MEVTHVEPGGPADEQGVRIGWSLYSVEGLADREEEILPKIYWQVHTVPCMPHTFPCMCLYPESFMLYPVCQLCPVLI